MGKLSPNTIHQELKLGFGTKTVIYQRLRNKKTTPSSPLLLFYWTGSGTKNILMDLVTLIS